MCWRSLSNDRRPVRQDMHFISNRGLALAIWPGAQKFVFGVCAGAGYNPATLSLNGGGVAGIPGDGRTLQKGERR
jgi:hypothetical protein